MARALFEAFLGRLFTALLHFYEANSLIINSFIAAYGLVMVLSWSNLVSIRKRLVKAMVDQMREAPERYAKARIKHVLRDVEIPWEGVVSEARFPFVAPRLGFYPRRRSVVAVQSLLPDRELAREALEVLGVAGDEDDQESSSGK